MEKHETLEENGDILFNKRYLKKSWTLMSELLKRGCDVIQMPNGDIIASQATRVVLRYRWDKEIGRLVRAKVSHKMANIPVEQVTLKTISN